MRPASRAHRIPGGAGVAFALGALLLPAATRAQEAATGEAKGGKPAGRGFTVTLKVEEGWESNPQFEVPDEPASYYTRLGGGIGYFVSNRSVVLTIGADAGAVFYQQLQDRNTFVYGGTLVGTFRLARRTTLVLGEALTYDYARRSALLVGDGIILPLDRALTSRSTMSLEHLFSPKTKLKAHFQLDHVSFDQSDLQNGDQFGAGLSIGRQLSRRHSLSIGYDYQRGFSDVLNHADFHTGLLSWNVTFNPQANLTLTGGATAIQELDRSWRLTPTGSALLSVRNRHPELRIDLRYDRNVSQAFGRGLQRIADIASLNLSRALGRKVSVSVGYGYGFSQDTNAGGTPFRFTTQNANGGLHYAIVRSVLFDVGYAFFRTTETAAGLDSHAVIATLSYRRAPR